MMNSKERKDKWVFMRLELVFKPPVSTIWETFIEVLHNNNFKGPKWVGEPWVFICKRFHRWVWVGNHSFSVILGGNGKDIFLNSLVLMGKIIKYIQNMIQMQLHI